MQPRELKASVVYMRRPGNPDIREIPEPGITIRELLDREGIEEFELPTLCLFNDEAKGRSEWAETRIELGDVVTFITLPEGGGGGGSNPLQVILLLTLTALAPILAPALLPAAAGEFAVNVTAGLIALSGAFLINALFPPLTPNTDDNAPSPTYSISSPGNQARLGQPRPVGYGRMLVTPAYAEQPFDLFEGQNAIDLDTGTGEPPSQFLHLLLDIGEGLYDIEEVRFGDTSVDSFEEVEFEKYDPGATIDLIPQSVRTNASVTGLPLPGPADPNFLGQILPATKTAFLTATGGTQDDGTGHGILTHTGAGFATDGSLIGREVYIGGAEEPVDFESTVGNENFDDPVNASQPDKLAHPSRLRTIVAVPDSNTLKVRPAWDATYGPHNAAERDYHVRDDYLGPFTVNDSGTIVNKIGIDIKGAPLFWSSNRGSRRPWGLGMRFEKRQIDDAGVPVAGSAGDWSPLGSEFTDWAVASDGTHQIGIFSSLGLIFGFRSDVRAVLSRRSTIALWGAGQLVDPLALSFLYDVPDGRYEVRGKRATFFSNSNRVSNVVQWAGLKGYVKDSTRTFPTTTLAIRARGTGQINSRTATNIKVLFKRKVATWGDSASIDLPVFSLTSAQNTNIVTVTHANHRFAVGQPFTVSNHGSLGGIPAIEIDAAQTVDTVIDANSYTFKTTTVATLTSSRNVTPHIEAAGGFWSAPVHTANWVWALIDAAKGAYGGNRSDAKLDLEALRTLADQAMTRGDEFNAYMDTRRRLWDAYQVIARVGRSRCIKPDGILTAVRDEPRVIRQAVFSPRNIRPGSLSVEYGFFKPDAPDSVELEYFDRVKWTPDTVVAGVAGETTDRPARVTVFGITDREHANREALYMAAANRYRRVKAKFRTELQGHIPSFMGLVTLSYPWTGWGAGGDIVGYDAGTFMVTTSEPLDWKNGPDELTGDDIGFEGGLGSWIAGSGSNVTVTQWSDLSALFQFAGGALGAFLMTIENNKGSLVGVTDEAQVGTGAALLTYNGDPSVDRWAETYFNASTGLDLRQGVTYKYSCWVKAKNTQAVGKTCKIFIREHSVSEPNGFFNGDITGANAESMDVALSTEWQYLEAIRAIKNNDVTSLTPRCGMRGGISPEWAVHLEGSTGAQGQEEVLYDNARLELWGAYKRAKDGVGAMLIDKGASGTNQWAYAEIVVSPAGQYIDIGDEWTLECDILPVIAGGDQLVAFVRSEPFIDFATSAFATAGTSPTTDRTWYHLKATGSIKVGADANGAITNLRILVGTSDNQFPANSKVAVDNVRLYRSGDNVDHFVAFEKKTGDMDGPFAAVRVPGTNNQLTLPGALLVPPTTIPDGRERTRYVFGASGAWARDMIVAASVPRSGNAIEMQLINEDARVHSADQATYVPPGPEVTPPGVPDAPVVDNVDAYEFGDEANRRVNVSWTPAPGADFYQVQQMLGNVTGRKVNIAAGAIIGGPLQVNEPLRGFGQVQNFTILGAMTGTNLSTTVIVQENGHGLQNLDWVLIHNSPGLAGIPAGEINGPHQITLIDANLYSFQTTTPANTTGSQEVPGAQFANATGMTGKVLRGPTSGDNFLFYHQAAGPDPNIQEWVAGETSRGYGFAFKDAQPTARQVLMGETANTFLEGPLVFSDDTPLAVSVRVRGAGKLFGPWKSTAVVQQAPKFLQIPFDTTGRALSPDAGIGLGAVLTLFAWIDDANVTVSMGILPEHAIPLRAYYRCEETFDGTGNLAQMGITSDAGRFITAVNAVVGEAIITPGGGSAGAGLLQRITTIGGEEVFAKYIGSGATLGRMAMFLDYQVLPTPPV